ncbi:MAG: TonB-dependent receptor [Ignavibacterium sp.]|nr:TonB-dependent receptor [Ignavibacterium sp.]
MRSLIFALLILFNSISFPQYGDFKGKVTDGILPIQFVNIFLLNTTLGTASQSDGTFRITGVPVGIYEVRFSSIGYETRVFDITISEGKTVEINVVLKTSVIEVDDVEVTGLRQQKQSDTRTSLIDLNPRDAKILPGAAEDVLRTLQSLPGVLAPNDFSSQLIVRGSGPDQNLIIMDDVEVFNPYRLYGVISMFNPDAVSDVNLISGGFPAKYGDRLSAVLDVTNREGSINKNLTGSLNASIVDANLVLEGKNPFDIKGSWLLNSRRTYYDLIIEPFVKSAGLVEESTTFPNFYDVQGKLVFGPFNGHKFLFNGVYSRDGVNVISGEDRNTADSVGVFNVTRNDIISGAWHYVPNKKFFNKFVVSWYRNSGDTDFDSQILDPSLNRSDFEDVLPDTLRPYLLGFKFNGDFSYTKISIDDKLTYFWKDHVFEAGAGYDFMETRQNFNFELDPQLEAIFLANPQVRASLSDLRDLKKYNRFRAFAQNNFKLSNKLYFNPSLRFDYYDLLDKSYLAPRISLSYAIDEITTIRAVWGMYYQSPGYEKLRDQNVLFDLGDRYAKNLNAERAYHYVFGIERWLDNEWSLRFESYYKDFQDLIVPQIVEGTRFFIEPVPGRNSRFIDGWTSPVPVKGDSVTQIPINNAFGEAYGFEFFIAKKNLSRSSKLSGWISYSLAFADRYEYNNKFPFRFDQRHTINIVLNYDVSNWFNFGIRWQYGSGFPISEAIGVKPRIIYVDNDFDGIPETPALATRRSNDPSAEPQVIYDVDYGDRNFNSRKPEYHRLDMRANFLTNFWGVDWIFYLDIINVYNRKNVIGYDYYIEDDLTLGKRPGNMFPILPTLGFSVKF